jgi:hypothetical protein
VKPTSPVAAVFGVQYNAARGGGERRGRGVGDREGVGLEDAWTFEHAEKDVLGGKPAGIAIGYVDLCGVSQIAGGI